jgi:hypothetical protein
VDTCNDKKLAEIDKDPQPISMYSCTKLSNIQRKDEVEKKTPKLSVYGYGVSAVECGGMLGWECDCARGRNGTCFLLVH